MTLRQTNRWRGIVAVAFVSIGAGLLAKSPGLLLLAIAGVGYALYARVVPAPEAPTVELSRSVSDDEPASEEAVTVTLTVRNTGDTWLPDVRVVDGVPARLPVIAGTPRVATSLRPGGSTTIEYTVEARPGNHRFDPATIIVRNVAGSAERSTDVATSTVIDCFSQLSDVPVRDHTSAHPGPVPTTGDGRGIEFHRTREYQPGDPLDRIDWRQYARSGELTTIEFRPERAASVVIGIDVGTATAPSSPLAHPVTSDGLAKARAVANRMATSLTNRGHAVGLASLGHGQVFIPPTTGPDHLQQLHHAIDTDPAFGASAPSSGRAGADTDTGADVPRSSGAAVDRQATGDAARADGGRLASIHHRLRKQDQLLVISPLLDDQIVRTLLTVDGAEDRLLVLVPSVERTDGPGGRLVSLVRAVRIRTLQAAGIHVVDWETESSLVGALLAWIDR